MAEPENQNEVPKSEVKGTLLARQAQLAADLNTIAAQANDDSQQGSGPESSLRGGLLKQAETLPSSEVNNVEVDTGDHALAPETVRQEITGLEVGRIIFNRDSGILYTVMSVGEGVRPSEPIVVMLGQDGSRFTTKASRLLSILASEGGAWHY